MIRRPPRSTPFPYPTLFRSENGAERAAAGRAAHRRHPLDAPPQVAGPPVGRAEVVLGVAAVREMIDAGVLEEASQDADDADAVGQAGDARPERAHAPHDEVDVDAGRRCAVQRRDDLGIGETVELGANPRGPPRSGVLRPAADELAETLQTLRGA